MANHVQHLADFPVLLGQGFCTCCRDVPASALMACIGGDAQVTWRHGGTSLAMSEHSRIHKTQAQKSAGP
jgi:hypothetical protein